MSNLKVDNELAKEVPYTIASRAQFIPIKADDQTIHVATTKETDWYALDEYRNRAGKKVAKQQIEVEEFNKLLGEVFEGGEVAAHAVLAEMPLESLADELAQKADLLDAADDAPIIQLVNSIIVQALRDRASDIHIEPFENDVVVRFRVDGVLHQILRPPKPIQAPLMSRIKVMSGLNIAEKRLPQDGGMRVQLAGKDIDVRVSVLPTAHGERIVLRLLEIHQGLKNLTDLGLSGPHKQWFKERLALTHGIILVTGPTGSGKSTTLYAGLTEINSPEKNIITIEDPVEYTLEGIGQIQVNPKIGLTFAGGLRSILRQDPDVIMVGEIRDLETAQIAIQASLTGHLVLSTLHTNDTIGAIVRLMDMGIEPYLIGSSLEGVVAQRLVRKLCDNCKKPIDIASQVLDKTPLSFEELDTATFHQPDGCEKCMHTGYRGRGAIFEQLSISDELRELIDMGANSQKLYQQARKDGWKNLSYSGWALAARGQTSIEDMLRVIQAVD